jgi:hypothetical protein
MTHATTPATSGTVEDAETPFEGLKTYAGEQAKAARETVNHADEVVAYSCSHGFDRDPAVMSQVQAMHDAAEAHAAAAEAAVRALSSHEPGAEYHGTGTDAHASAFRPA